MSVCFSVPVRAIHRGIGLFSAKTFPNQPKVASQLSSNAVRLVCTAVLERRNRHTAQPPFAPISTQSISLSRAVPRFAPVGAVSQRHLHPALAAVLIPFQSVSTSPRKPAVGSAPDTAISSSVVPAANAAASEAASSSSSTTSTPDASPSKSCATYADGTGALGCRIFNFFRRVFNRIGLIVVWIKEVWEGYCERTESLRIYHEHLALHETGDARLQAIALITGVQNAQELGMLHWKRAQVVQGGVGYNSSVESDSAAQANRSSEKKEVAE